MSLYSVKVEKHVLAGLLKHPDALPDIDTYLTVEDFYNEVHQVIYSVIRSSVISGERVDKVLVSDTLSNLGITAKDEVNIFEYIDESTLWLQSLVHMRPESHQKLDDTQILHCTE